MSTLHEVKVAINELLKWSRGAVEDKRIEVVHPTDDIHKSIQVLSFFTLDNDEPINRTPHGVRVPPQDYHVQPDSNEMVNVFRSFEFFIGHPSPLGLESAVRECYRSMVAENRESWIVVTSVIISPVYTTHSGEPYVKGLVVGEKRYQL